MTMCQILLSWLGSGGKLNAGSEYFSSLLAEVDQNISHAIIQDISILFLSLGSLVHSPGDSNLAVVPPTLH